MRRDDPPAVIGPEPHLALPAGRRPSYALEFGVGGGEVLPIGGDHRLYQIAGQVDGRAPGAKSGDLVIAVEILGRAVAERVPALPEQSVEFDDVVCNQRALIAGERPLDLGDHFGNVDLDHRPGTSAEWDAQRSPRSRGFGWATQRVQARSNPAHPSKENALDP